MVREGKDGPAGPASEEDPEALLAPVECPRFQWAARADREESVLRGDSEVPVEWAPPADRARFLAVLRVRRVRRRLVSPAAPAAAGVVADSNVIAC